MKETNSKSDIITESMDKKMDEINKKVQQYLVKYMKVLSLPDNEQNAYWDAHPKERDQLTEELEKYESVLGVINEWVGKETAMVQEEYDAMTYKVDEYLKYNS